MTELPQPKLIAIEFFPKKSKLFLQYFIVPYLIFFLLCKIFSIHLIFVFVLTILMFWLALALFFYMYGKQFFGGMTEQLKRQGEQFNYSNRGVWINSQDKTIILFDQPDQRMVKYHFGYIQSIGRYDVIENDVHHYTTVINSPLTGTQVNHERRVNPAKREYQVNIGTSDPFKPNYCLKFFPRWKAEQAASDIRKLLSADQYS